MRRRWLPFFLFFLCSLSRSNPGSGTGMESPSAICPLADPVHNVLLDDYDVKFYFIDIEVNDSSTTIHGSTSVLAELLDTENTQLILDMGNMLHVDSVFLDQIETDFSHVNEELIITKPLPSTKGSLVSIQVYYHGEAERSSYFAGLFHEEDMVWGNKVTWSLSEPFSARNWFPCKQVLDDKADSVYVFITTDQHLKAGSNGILTAQTELSGGKIRHEWKSRYPVAYYLISFAVSNYRDYSIYVPLSGKDDSLLIQNYIYDNDVFFRNYKDDIDKTRDLISLYETLFGPYPFQKEKYGHCIVPSGGGMEHQTMTTLENFTFSMVSHELAHQWFGDYVTCSTWQDIWINEGFASYAEYLAYQYLVSQEKADQWMTSAQEMVKFRPDGSICIPPDKMDDEGRIFDFRLTYKKGAAIIHMIRHEIQNDSLFFDILRDFLSSYQNQTASAMDFRDLLEKRTAMDFTGFFDQWYYGEGYPVVQCSWQQKNDTLYIQALQTTTASTPLFELRMDFRITRNGRDSLVTRRQTSNLEMWKVPIPGEITAVQADPFHWLLGDISSIQGKDLAHAENIRYCPTCLHNIGFIDNPDNLLPYKIVKD